MASKHWIGETELKSARPYPWAVQHNCSGGFHRHAQTWCIAGRPIAETVEWQQEVSATLFPEAKP